MVTTLMDWPETKHPCRAGVSSFGMGGTNAHVVLEEAPFVPEEPRISVPQILPVSARNQESLYASCARLAHFLEGKSSSKSTFGKADFKNIAYTLQAGRRTFAYRHAVVAKESAGASEMLSGISTKKMSFQHPLTCSLR